MTNPPIGAQPAPPARRQRRRRKSRFAGTLIDGAHVFALCGFAIAQPLFDLLGNNPTFFVAHDLDGSDIVKFALGVVFLPPLVLFGILFVARLISATVLRFVRDILVGALVGVIVVPPIARAVGFSSTAWIAGVAVVSIGAAVAYDQVRMLRTFVTYLTPAPILFLVLLLFSSPAHVLVSGSSAQAAEIGHVKKTPVVMVIFDEFPLGLVMDDKGQVNSARFPGFGRLASMSTWYRNAATVALYTHMAVPAAASGLLPVRQPLPVAANYPRSIFTMLAGTHYPHAIETLTRLCAEDICKHRDLAQVKGELVDDVETVFLHSMLSDHLAVKWGVPPTNDRWAAFGQDEPTLSTLTPKTDPGLPIDEQTKILSSSDKLGSWAAFDEELGTGKSPGLWFLHSLLPHRPFLLLPGGRRYPGSGITGMDDDLFWGSDQDYVDVALQRSELQLMAADELLDKMLTRLDDLGILDDAMVIVTADHGAVFKAGENYRALIGVTDNNKNQVMPIPLFIKYPNQPKGAIDDRSARSIDIVPTIADQLDANLPDDWKFDGVSLLGKAIKNRPYPMVLDTEHDAVNIPGPISYKSFAQYVYNLLGPGGGEHDGYRIGPYGSLVGSPADPLVRDGSGGNVNIAPGFSDEVNGAFGVVPAKIEGTIKGVSDSDWVAVVANGTIAGVGPVYRSGDSLGFLAMFDPALLHSGTNDIKLYRIDAYGTELRALS